MRLFLLAIAILGLALVDASGVAGADDVSCSVNVSAGFEDGKVATSTHAVQCSFLPRGPQRAFARSYEPLRPPSGSLQGPRRALEARGDRVSRQRLYGPGVAGLSGGDRLRLLLVAFVLALGLVGLADSGIAPGASVSCSARAFVSHPPPNAGAEPSDPSQICVVSVGP